MLKKNQYLYSYQPGEKLRVLWQEAEIVFTIDAFQYRRYVYICTAPSPSSVVFATEVPAADARGRRII